MRRLRIAEIMEATTGGTRRHLVDLATHLDPEKFEVVVVAANLRDKAFDLDVERFRSLGIGVHLLPMVRDISLRDDWRSLQRLAAHLRDHEYDVIHLHSAKAGALGRWAARRSGVAERARIVYTPHVFPFLMQVSRPKRWCYLQVEKLCAPFTHRWIAVSDTDYEAALARGICRPEQITTILNGIDRHRFNQLISKEEARGKLGLEADAFVLGNVGRLTKQKDQSTLITAAAQIVRALPHARFLLVGEGEDRPALEKLTRDLDLGKHVHFTGYQENVERLYPAMDVFVLPSLWEGCPYTLMEAMYAELPVIATDIPGNRGIVLEGVNGSLVPPSNPLAIHEAAMQLHRNPEARRAMGTAGHQHIDTHFTLEKMIEATEEVYLQAAGA